MTSHILLVRPVAPGYNPETATSNAFQQLANVDAATAQQRVQSEFDAFANALRKEGIDVIVIEDTPVPAKPDAIFPNNWVSFHKDGRVILYPMMAPSRREERRRDVVEQLRKKFEIKEVTDLSRYEKEGRHLEGTGSIVFDHVNQVAYACLSPRTDKELFVRVCELLEYEPVSFTAFDHSGQPYYHTNVMMCVGEEFCIICLDSIADSNERQQVKTALRKSGLEVITISQNQVSKFAGNMLSVRSREGEALLVCSSQAADCLTDIQRKILEKYARLLPLSIPTIETIGGGSARCMMAEIFLQPVPAKG